MLFKANLFYDGEGEIEAAELYTGGPKKYRRSIYIEDEIKSVKIIKILEKNGSEASAIVEPPEELLIETCIEEFRKDLRVHKNLYENELKALV